MDCYIYIQNLSLLFCFPLFLLPFLFDDIFDKLDDQRVEQLISLVSNNSFGQIFITDTQRQRTEKIFKTVNIDHKIFTVDAGIINED